MATESRTERVPFVPKKHSKTFSSLLPSPLEGGSAGWHKCHCLQLTSFQLRRNSLFHLRQMPQSWETLILNQNYTHVKNYPFTALSDNEQYRFNEQHASSPLLVSLDIAAEHPWDHGASKPSLPEAIKLSIQCCLTAAPAPAQHRRDPSLQNLDKRGSSTHLTPFCFAIWSAGAIQRNQTTAYSTTC